MRSKPVQWLAAAALLVTFTTPGWAQPQLLGEEFQVNTNKDTRQLVPVAAFGPSGIALVVWENDRHGILGRLYDRKGAPLSGELALVPNKNLPGIPAFGEVLVRKDPALAFLPGGEFLLFWTEERDYLNLDYFYENREILDQDVYGQRFSAFGVPQGERFRVNADTEGLQRRPQVAVKTGGIVVVWESGESDRSSDSVQGRLLTRRGQPTGDELRVDSGSADEIWNLALAANNSGDFLVAWESNHVDGPNIHARIFDKDGSPVAAEQVVNTITLGRQRRPAALATRNGDFLVAWQGFLKNTDYHGVNGQFLSSAGAPIGNELKISKGVGEVQISPALALLPSGNIVVAWMDWISTWPIGAYAVVIDDAGRTLGDEIKISKARLYPQYRMSVAANAQGEILATWEGRTSRKQSIAARRLQAH